MGAAVARVTIVHWKWAGWRPSYTLEHVRALSRQLKEFAEIPYRLVLLTDDMNESTAEQAEVDAIYPIPTQPEGISPGHGSPANCFRRLRLFDEKYSVQFGTEWVMSLDLDTLILAPIGEVLEYMTTAPAGFSIMRARFSGYGRRPYNGGMYAIRVGSYPEVWSSFNWKTSPERCKQTGWVGSDQVWISLHVPDARTVGPEHGVYFAEQYLAAPPDRVPGRIVTFAGGLKPWNKTSRRETPAYFAAYQRFA